MSIEDEIIDLTKKINDQKNYYAYLQLRVWRKRRVILNNILKSRKIKAEKAKQLKLF